MDPLWPGAIQNLVVTARQFKGSLGMCGRFRPQLLTMDPLLPGAIHEMVVTARQFKGSLGMCGRCRPQLLHLLPFWTMDPLLPGAIHEMVVTARQCKSSSGMCGRCRPQLLHLLPSWTMDPLLPGALHDMVVTARQFKGSLGMCGRFRPQLLHLLPFWTMDPLLPGAIHEMVVTAPQCKICSNLYRCWFWDTSPEESLLKEAQLLQTTVLGPSTPVEAEMFTPMSSCFFACPLFDGSSMFKHYDGWLLYHSFREVRSDFFTGSRIKSTGIFLAKVCLYFSSTHMTFQRCTWTSNKVICDFHGLILFDFHQLMTLISMV